MFLNNQLVYCITFYFNFRRRYLIIKKTDFESYSPKFRILNVDIALILSNYTSWKHFICLKWILNKCSTILHTQFNYHTLQVSPFIVKWKLPKHMDIKYVKLTTLTQNYKGNLNWIKFSHIFFARYSSIYLSCSPFLNLAQNCTTII